MPFGLGAAIYMAEYARPRIRAVLKPSLEVLAGIPTVVFGYFALTFTTPLLRSIGIDVDIFNALSAGIVVGIMLIPTVASVSEDAMQAVPAGLRQGSYGLGAIEVPDVDAGDRARRPSPASSPRSCSPSRAPSARR